jgi:hypothetical protein
MRRRGPRRSRRSLVTAGRSARGSGYPASLAAGLVLSTGFQLAHEIPHAVSPWVPVAVMLAVLASATEDLDRRGCR